MKDQEKLAMLEEIFELEDGTLNTEDELDRLDCWDSMAALSLIVLMSDSFNKKLTGQAIEKLKTVRDILNLME